MQLPLVHVPLATWKAKLSTKKDRQKGHQKRRSFANPRLLRSDVGVFGINVLRFGIWHEVPLGSDTSSENKFFFWAGVVTSWHPFSTSVTVVMRKSSHLPGADRIGPSWCGINTLAPCHSPGAHTKQWWVLQLNVLEYQKSIHWHRLTWMLSLQNSVKRNQTRTSETVTKRQRTKKWITSYGTPNPPTPHCERLFCLSRPVEAQQSESLNHRFICDLS